MLELPRKGRIVWDMSDEATIAVPPVQSTAAPNQNAPETVLETIPTPEMAQNHENGHSSTPPAKRTKAEPFNKQNARMYALKSWEARRAAEAAAKLPPAQSPALPAPNARLELIREQIELTRSILNDKRIHFCSRCERAGIEPHHRAQLLRALECLLDRERKLLGIADPGTLKPVSQSRRRSDPSPEPTPTPQEPSA